MSNESEITTGDGSSKMGFVYILRSGSTNRFKIGRTSGSVENRIKQLNTGNPDCLQKFDVIETEDPPTCETYLHQRLMAHKHYGNGGTEFFEVDPDSLVIDIENTREFMRNFISIKKAADVYKTSVSEDRVVQPDENLRKLHERLVEIRTEINMLDFEREYIENQLKVALGTASELQGIATWKTSRQVRFNQEVFREEYPDLFSKFSKESSIRKFSLVQK